jgi:hypothetical protein
VIIAHLVTCSLLSAVSYTGLKTNQINDSSLLQPVGGDSMIVSCIFWAVHFLRNRAAEENLWVLFCLLVS